MPTERPIKPHKRISQVFNSEDCNHQFDAAFSDAHHVLQHPANKVTSRHEVSIFHIRYTFDANFTCKVIKDLPVNLPGELMLFVKASVYEYFGLSFYRYFLTVGLLLGGFSTLGKRKKYLADHDANKYRQDVPRGKIHPIGFCGFDLNFLTAIDVTAR
ncbi:MAG: hypothetical protein ACI8ZB_003087 [Desulforhopalus sp.]